MSPGCCKERRKSLDAAAPRCRSAAPGAAARAQPPCEQPLPLALVAPCSTPTRGCSPSPSRAALKWLPRLHGRSSRSPAAQPGARSAAETAADKAQRPHGTRPALIPPSAIGGDESLLRAASAADRRTRCTQTFWLLSLLEGCGSAPPSLPCLRTPLLASPRPLAPRRADLEQGLWSRGMPSRGAAAFGLRHWGRARLRGAELGSTRCAPSGGDVGTSLLSPSDAVWDLTPEAHRNSQQGIPPAARLGCPDEKGPLRPQQSPSSPAIAARSHEPPEAAVGAEEILCDHSSASAVSQLARAGQLMQQLLSSISNCCPPRVGQEGLELPREGITIYSFQMLQ